MKTIRRNFLLLAFAAGALFLIGNNVFGSDPTMPVAPTGDQGGEIKKGTLYSNQSGTLYCCCPGINDCAAASCSNCPQ
jgi:hypothetical protein